MHKKQTKPKRVSNDFKQNAVPNDLQQHPYHPKTKTIRKAGLPLMPLQDNQQKHPLQLRVLCERQQQQILAEYQAKRLDQKFYNYVRCQLADSSLFRRIKRIQEMTNEEAVEQLQRIQENKQKASSYYTCQSQLESQSQFSDSEPEDKTVFLNCGKRVSMIEENDDAYLEELGADKFALQSPNEAEEQPPARQEECISFACLKYQYNDDIFEL